LHPERQEKKSPPAKRSQNASRSDPPNPANPHHPDEPSVLFASPSGSSNHATAIGPSAVVRHLNSVLLISRIACFAVAIKPNRRTKN
jgi:hypothetical protein